MSWQQIIENGTEIGTTMILDTLIFHAVGEFASITNNAFIKELANMTENGQLFTKEYVIEVAGVGKMAIQEGAEATAATLANSETKSIASTAQKSGGRIMQERGKAFEEFLHKQLGGSGN
ncbi:MAG TPA: hypothetical protein VJJ26_00845 [Candidatus Babeliales bacterium]|nr:hypothetical protein [Candidatus Babeliales bacterium]